MAPRSPVEQYDLQFWHAQARQQQSQIFRSFGPGPWWQGLMPSNAKDPHLTEAVAYLVLGPPPHPGQMNLTHVGYTSKQLQKVSEFTNLLCRRFRDQVTFISVIFVLSKLGIRQETNGVLRVWSEHRQLFLDSDCEEYSTWRHYLKNNDLPRRYICYPTDGVYALGVDLQLCLEYGETPAMTSTLGVSRKVLKYLGLVTVALLVLVMSVVTILLVLGFNGEEGFIALGCTTIFFGVIGAFYRLLLIKIISRIFCGCCKHEEE